MPQLNLFSGTSRKRNNNYCLDIQGRGNQADLTLTDKNKTVAAHIQLITLEEFNQQKSLDQSNSILQENFFNTWSKIITATGVTIYSSDPEEPVIVFTSDNNPDCDLTTLIRHFLIVELRYFHELSFAITLNHSYHLTFDDLRKLMNEEQMALIQAHNSAFLTLLEHQFTLFFIRTLDKNTLERFLTHAKKLDNALQVVTIGQILGQSHEPVKLPKEKPETKTNAYIQSKITFPDFEYSVTVANGSREVLLTDHIKNTTSQILTLDSTNKDYHHYLKHNGLKMAPTQIINTWYSLPETCRTDERVLFCPSKHTLVIENIQLDFPMQKLQETNIMPLLSPYHAEVDFVNQLAMRGYAIDELRKIQGITQEKCELLKTHASNIYHLLDQGLNLNDLGEVSIERMQFVLTHFNSVKSALHFVKPEKLFGLNKTKISFFQSAPSTNSMPNEQQKFSLCSIF